MISTELALSLRDAGLVWHPQSGDRFQLDEPEFEADVFTVSEMTIEPRVYATGRILAFNGTTDWALDAVLLAKALHIARPQHRMVAPAPLGDVVEEGGHVQHPGLVPAARQL